MNFSQYLVGIVTVIYLAVSIWNLAINKNLPMALVFLGYSLSNIGLLILGSKT